MNVGCHKGHCCTKHGCKYGNPDCPVATGKIKQSGPCEECGLEAEGYYDGVGSSIKSIRLGFNGPAVREPVCPVDPTCTFWPKGQCSRPYEEKDACWNCAREIIRELNMEIDSLKHPSAPETSKPAMHPDGSVVIQFCGRKAKVNCDRKCSKAWGINSRPKTQLSDDGDDYAFLADGEVPEAPADPGTSEGGEGKPLSPEEFPNKWCVRECERCSMSKPGEWGEPLTPRDFSKRFYNIPQKHKDGK